MNERHCFVGSIHPGSEHQPDVGDLKALEQKTAAWACWVGTGAMAARPCEHVGGIGIFLAYPIASA